MNCPSCKRPNAEGIDFCDFCGTPLGAAPAAKRRTEVAADPLDPFAPRASGKRKTAFDPNPADPFAPPEVKKDKGAGRRIVGFLVTFDRAPEGAYWVIREGRNTLGRDEDCDIVIDGDEMVSSTHAVILWRNGRTIVDDEKSQNGTFLNEADVMEKTDLEDGDVLRVGRTQMICRLLDQAKISSLWKPAT